MTMQGGEIMLKAQGWNSFGGDPSVDSGI
jgi:hypothetical protein